MNIINKKSKSAVQPLKYAEKKTLFSEKEIIFRSSGRAKVWHISSRAQVIFLSIILLVGVWSFYSYHLYNQSGSIISYKDKELDETRDAYVELMTDFVTLHKNIGSMISSIDKGNIKNNKEYDNYKRQALVVEDKIKQITDEKEWLSSDTISEKTSLSEALLQRDIASSERDALRKQMQAMEETIKEIIKAAQHSPTAHNKQPWEFLVIDDREFLANLRHIQRWTSFAKDADCVVIVCGDIEKSFNRNKEDEKWSFIDVDCAIATQSLMLAAWAKGIGTCYCGAAPMQRVVDSLREHLNLPDNIRPFAIVTMGYPAETPKQPDDRYKEEKIHWGQW